MAHRAASGRSLSLVGSRCRATSLQCSPSDFYPERFRGPTAPPVPAPFRVRPSSPSLYQRTPSKLSGNRPSSRLPQPQIRSKRTGLKSPLLHFASTSTTATYPLFFHQNQSGSFRRNACFGAHPPRQKTARLSDSFPLRFFPSSVHSSFCLLPSTFFRQATRLLPSYFLLLPYRPPPVQ